MAKKIEAARRRENRALGAGSVKSGGEERQRKQKARHSVGARSGGWRCGGCRGARFRAAHPRGFFTPLGDIMAACFQSTRGGLLGARQTARRRNAVFLGIALRRRTRVLHFNAPRLSLCRAPYKLYGRKRRRAVISRRQVCARIDAFFASNAQRRFVIGRRGSRQAETARAAPSVSTGRRRRGGQKRRGSGD
jgi:hypothetical protein